jgi:hypothetical protein
MSTREVFREFEFLLDKSQKSFNKLRDLPPYGNSRWEHHFHKAFHVYSKLWKFQQEHRWGPGGLRGGGCPGLASAEAKERGGRAAAARARCGG